MTNDALDIAISALKREQQLMKINDEDRQRYISYIKEWDRYNSKNIDYDEFLEDCLNKIKISGIKSLDKTDAHILANIFFKKIYDIKSKSTLDKAIQLYYDYDVDIYKNSDPRKFAADMIHIYKEYE